ncbi:MAG TPA: hypothetical protein VG269_02025, partial [Tepidisphaeraceae bacterium]|nr:hypothetical protein [Tepidisphaeraceae bacterium]
MDKRVGHMEELEHTVKMSDLLRNALRWLPAAEVLGATGTVSFVIAVIVNTVVFAFWGLNFLSVVSVSDIVVSGFTGLFTAMPLLMLSVIAISIPIPKHVIRHSRLYKRIFYVSAVSIILVGGIAFIYAFKFVNIFGDLLIIRITEIYYAFAVIAVAIYLYSLRITFLEIVIEGGEESDKRKLIRIIAFQTIGVVFLSVMVAAIRLVDEGYFLQPMAVVTKEPLPDGCVFPRVLWNGEHSIVVACATNDRLTNKMNFEPLLGYDYPIRVVKSEEAVEFVPYNASTF